MSEFCKSCGTRIHQDYEQARLKDLLKEESDLVGLWGRIMFVSKNDLERKRFVALDAAQTAVFLNIIKLKGLLESFPSSELS